MNLSIFVLHNDYYISIPFLDDEEKQVFIAAIVDKEVSDDLLNEKITWEDIVEEVESLFFIGIFKDPEKGNLVKIQKLTQEDVREHFELIFTKHTIEYDSSTDT